MNSFFSNLFNKNTHLDFPSSILIDNIKSINDTNICLFENLTIYHRDESITIPLLILDYNHGIYLFEYKKWSLHHLNNTTINKSANQHPSKSNLYFTKINKFITQKFKDITDTNGITIFNFLLLEELTADEYDTLEISFQELLPKQRLIFKNSTKDEILAKLHETPQLNISKQEVDTLMASLLPQYTIIDNDKRFLATKEQRHFIELPIKNHQTLNAPSYSGKSSALLLKSILLKLQYPEYKTLIISPSLVDCNILKQKMLNILEYSMIHLDVTSIEIMTPINLINRHLTKLKKNLLEDELIIDTILMKKSYKVADFIICDDSDLLPREFISYLIHLQKNLPLLLVSHEEIFKEQQVFQNTFRLNKQAFIFQKAKSYPTTLQIVKELLQNHSADDILILSKNIVYKNFYDDLKFYMYGKTSLLDDSTNLIDHDLKNLTLSSYSMLSSIRYKFVILLDIDLASISELIHASNLSKESVYYLYDEECKNIEILRDKFETKTK